MIRLATPADLIMVLRICRQGFAGDDRFGALWFLKKVAEPGTVLQVDDAGLGAIRGFLLTQAIEQGTLVRMIGVERGYQRQGVGTGLLATVTGPAGAWVRDENVASRTLFTRAGFRTAVPEWTEDARKKNPIHTGKWLLFVRD